MKTFYAWSAAPLYDRLSVYDNYVELARSRGDFTALEFEEFDQLYRNCSFYFVVNRFGVTE